LGNGARTRMTPTPRLAARVLVIDPEGHVLLLKGFDPARPEAGTWWLVPGGGVDAGESFEEAARRELREETGLVVDDVGASIFERRVVFEFEADHFSQLEHFFCVRTDRFELDRSAWTDLEMRSVLEHRWWSHAELVVTEETIYPEALAERLAALLDS